MRFLNGKISDRIRPGPSDLSCFRTTVPVPLVRYRQFYLTYPQIVEAAAPQLTAVLQNKQPWQLLTVKSKQRIAGSIVESLPPQLTNSGQTLLSRLSFTHFADSSI